jgi:hypothetical protein
MKLSDKSKRDMIGTSRHKSKFSTVSINDALERAINDDKFVDTAIKCIESLTFPAYKNDILPHLKNKNTDKEIISLFESLDGYIQYNDLYHVRKSIEQNIPEKKFSNQISDQMRQNLDVRIRETRSNHKSNKDREAVDSNEERKDYPEVTPTAMSVFICSMCGKEFQNQDDMVHHRQFERGENQGTEANENKAKSRLNKNLVPNDPQIEKTSKT